ncbi:hypothetical protein QYM36_010357 [Artemia franciscana]|uniref:Uncharacterized protein n=1 Tax=Artemia franciscana TaxID=6661 RepID=A0AA88L7E6_ARTSF|nr:hypothetical protein QYM36_010357 [Artemia franciscana]
MPKHKRRIKIMESVCNILEAIPAIELCKLSKKCYVELLDLMGQKRDLELSAGFWPIYKKDEITESAVNGIRPLCKSLSLVLNARKSLDLGSDTGRSAVSLSMDKMSNKPAVEGKMQMPSTFETEAASKTSSSSIVLHKDSNSFELNNSASIQTENTTNDCFSTSVGTSSFSKQFWPHAADGATTSSLVNGK